MLTSSSIGRNITNDGINYCGGTSTSTGAYLTVMGKDNGGYFNLVANDGTYTQNLVGYTSGSLAWSGLSFIRTVNNSELQLCGGTNYASGASIILYGKDTTSLNGMFRIRAAISGSEYIDLCGWPNGTLQWGGVDVLRRGMHNNWSHSSSFCNVAHATSAYDDTGSCIDLGQPDRNGVCGVWRGKSDNYTFVESIYGQTDGIWWYAMNNSDVDNGVNSPRSTMVWYGNDGTLSTNKVRANDSFYCGSYRIYVG